MKYDYVIQNGYVIDPAVGTETVKSVYIRNNRIVEPPVDGTVETLWSLTPPAVWYCRD